MLSRKLTREGEIAAKIIVDFKCCINLIFIVFYRFYIPSTPVTVLILNSSLWNYVRLVLLTSLSGFKVH